MHQNIECMYMIVRHDEEDLRLAVAVCSTTSLEEAYASLAVFIELAPRFAPTAMYAVRKITVAYLYQNVL